MAPSKGFPRTGYSAPLTPIKEVLDARTIPPVDDLVVETFATSPTQSILAIYDPEQPTEMQPYLRVRVG